MFLSVLFTKIVLKVLSCSQIKKNMSNKFMLCEANYIISDNLHKSLQSGCLSDNSEDSGSEQSVSGFKSVKRNHLGVYLVVFRLLKKDSNVLLYNYIYYPYMFLITLLYYFIWVDKSKNLVYREWGNFFVVSDASFYNFEWKSEAEPLALNRKFLDRKLVDLYHGDFNIGSVINVIKNMSYISKSEDMGYLVDLMYKKKYSEFIRFVFSSAPFYHLLEDKWCKSGYNLDDDDLCSKNYSFIDSCLFIVQDLALLKNNLKNKGYIVNEGPQSLRGQVNSMNNFLNLLDLDYRRSLYNHNFYHSSVGNCNPLDRNRFSFKNIHINLGNVRWYSTSVKLKNGYTKSKTRDNVKTKSSSLKIIKLKNNLPTKVLVDKKSKSNRLILFTQLGEYLKKLPINDSSQREIENFLWDYSYKSYKIKQEEQKNSLIKFDLINSNLTKLLKDKEVVLNNYINNIRSRVFLKKPGKGKKLFEYYLTNIISELDNSFIISLMYGKLLRIISNYKILENTERDLCIDIGNELVNKYYYTLYFKDKQKLKDNDLSYTFSDWKMANSDITSIYDDEEIRPNISVILFRILMENTNLVVVLLNQSGREYKQNYVLPTQEVSNVLKDEDSLVHLPVKIPMIVKPKPYYRENIKGEIKERLGGYLLNDENYYEEMIIPNKSLKEPPKIKDDNLLYKLVNNVNSVGYRINKDVLDFVYLYGEKYNLIISDKYKHPLLEKPKLTKPQYSELEEFLSKKVLQENVLALADAYSNVHEFYLPVRLDFRGRCCCSSQYLNYQSTKLAKSLLLFSKPGKINKIDTKAIDYLKAYGALCYGNTLDKKSWNVRIKWTDDNLDNIVNFNNGKLLVEADNKLLFLAFCFEYNRWLKCLYNSDSIYFDTYLPVQLDATCNGYQHLALLSSDGYLLKKVNLTKSTWSDNPSDFYSYFSTNLPNLFRNKLNNSDLSSQDRDSYNRLININIVRKIIKSSIMTYPYNVSSWQMTNYIRDNFLVCDDMDELPFLDQWYQLRDNNEIKLKYRDFNLIKAGIKEILEDDLFKIVKLQKYLTDIARILTVLGLGISWGTPSGLDVNQNYLLPEEVTIKPFSYTKRSFTLKIPSRDKKQDTKKRIVSFMPNMVHSLDAASLALLADLIFTFDKQHVRNMYSVHDCFAVTANDVENLIDLLKFVYIKIYTDVDYLRKLDIKFKEDIKHIYGENSISENLKINVKGKGKLIFPSIEGVLGTDSSSASIILDSSYILT